MTPRILLLAFVAFAPISADADSFTPAPFDACLAEALTQRAKVFKDPEHSHAKENLRQSSCVYVAVTQCRFSDDPEPCSQALADHVLDYVAKAVAAMPDSSIASGKAKENYENRLRGMRRNLLFRERIESNPDLSDTRRSEAQEWWDQAVTRGRHPGLSPDLSERLLNAELAIDHLSILRSHLEDYPQ